ncbi:MAG: insulinase family protein [Clostridiales bacterium]|jgi:Zn-dependent M16 (insulinase) family peptidase|nr:insulinase family protein [Clostridiales bacterium]
MYTLISEKYLEDFRFSGEFWRHDLSGACVLRLRAPDAESTFLAAFRTPPSDDSGVFHVLEHSVLAGSRMYPVSDPFNELVKGSMNTFLNAMTFRDMTVYPASSRTPEDFANIVSVYADAVFAPLAAYDTRAYARERVIVLNEMIGAFADPTRTVTRLADRALFPDGPYRYDSGGFPDAVARLTYDRLAEAYRRYYHPSNCLIVLYGADPADAAMEAVGRGWLSRFERRQSEPPIAAVPPGGTFLAEAPGTPTLAAVFAADPPDCAEEVLSGAVLAELLAGNDERPARKAVAKARLAANCSAYFDPMGRQGLLRFVLRGAAGKAERFLGVLTEAASLPFAPEDVAAALNRAEFSCLAEEYGNRNRGIALGLAAAAQWKNGADIWGRFGRLSAIASVRGRGAGYFDELARRIVVSPYRAAYAGLTGGAAATEPPRFTDGAVYAEKPDSPEALARIPSLPLSAIGREPDDPRYSADASRGYALVLPERGTDGVAYADFWFDITDIPDDTLPYIGCAAWALTRLPTNSRSRAALRREIDTYLGHLGAAVKTVGRRAYFVLSAGAAAPNAARMFGLASEIAAQTCFGDETMAAEVLDEYKTLLARAIVAEGDSFAAVSAAAALRRRDYAADRASGIGFYQTLRAMSAGDASQGMARARDTLFARRRLTVCASVPAGVGAETFADAFAASLASGADLPHAALPPAPASEFFAAESGVNHTALALSPEVFAHEGYYAVAANIVRNGLFMDAIRKTGGAYGFSAEFPAEGGFAFTSFRDPNVAATFRVFESVPGYLSGIRPTAREMERFVIGAISRADRPKSPRKAAVIAAESYLRGDTSAARRERREAALSATARDIYRAAEAIAAALPKAARRAVGGSAEEGKDALGRITDLR